MANIVLIVIDSLRADHFTKELMPNTFNFARKGAIFSKAISTGPGTLQSFAGFFTSTHPLLYGGYTGLGDKKKTIAEILKERGYDTAMFHTNPLFVKFPSFGKGFDNFVDVFDESRTSIAGKPIAPATSINRAAIEWCKQKREKFFLCVHYMDVHSPYLPSYEGAIKNLDTHIHTLLDLLAEVPSTYVIILGDHGDEFGEHGGYFHHQKLYDELIRVPLVMVGPQIKSIEIDHQISLLDLPPTILDLLRIKIPDIFMGRSLIPLLNGNKMENYTCVSQTGHIDKIYRMDPKAIKISYRTNKWKYIYNASGKDELYNLEYDPKEKNNLL
ncbi:MAG: sulfatase [Candidatus Syntropharchaeia archaeon]